MDKDQAIMAALEGRAKRREERRAFVKLAGTSAAVLASSSLLAGCFGDNGDNNGTTTVPVTPTPSPAPEFDETIVTPGPAGFIVIFAIVQRRFIESVAMSGIKG